MRKFKKRIVWTTIIIFIVANIIVYNHAYCFTHFSETSTEKPRRPEDLSWGEKLKTLFTGVQVPKSKNNSEPQRDFSTFTIQSYEEIEGWDIPVDSSKGIVILFHGYISCKANMLAYSDAFNQKGYSTVLIDFMGHGGSGGLETTIGYKEGRDVKEVFEYVKKKYPEQEVILMGSSLGAVAIMKSVEEFGIKPDKLILQCPFGSLLETAKARFRVMKLPTTPLAHWLVLFGGWQTGFNAFEHNPTTYAKSINIPTALFNGAKDKRVSEGEIKDIYENLNGRKELTVFKESGHGAYLITDEMAWHRAVDGFLNE